MKLSACSQGAKVRYIGPTGEDNRPATIIRVRLEKVDIAFEGVQKIRVCTSVELEPDSTLELPAIDARLTEDSRISHLAPLAIDWNEMSTCFDAHLFAKLSGPGVYLFCSKDSVIYIGCGEACISRASSHNHHQGERATGALNVVIIPCHSIEQAKTLEIELIGRLRPTMNCRGSREFRRRKSAVLSESDALTSALKSRSAMKKLIAERLA